jgi:hypothetical protein
MLEDATIFNCGRCQRKMYGKMGVGCRFALVDGQDSSVEQVDIRTLPFPILEIYDLNISR